MASKPTVRYGSTGPAVVELQHRLNATRRPNDAALVPDGIFGPKTLAAVKKFQADTALVADGIVGPLTWGKLLVVTLDDTTAVAAQILTAGTTAPMPISFLIRAVMTGLNTSGRRK